MSQHSASPKMWVSHVCLATKAAVICKIITSKIKKIFCSPLPTQGCKILLVRSHLRVKCYAGRVKILTICVVLFSFTASQRKICDMRSDLFGNFTPLYWEVLEIVGRQIGRLFLHIKIKKLEKNYKNRPINKTYFWPLRDPIFSEHQTSILLQPFLHYDQIEQIL